MRKYWTRIETKEQADLLSNIISKHECITVTGQDDALWKTDGVGLQIRRIDELYLDTSGESYYRAYPARDSYEEVDLSLLIGELVSAATLREGRICIDNKPVEFTDEGITVGCTEVSKETVEEIARRLGLIPEEHEAVESPFSGCRFHVNNGRLCFYNRSASEQSLAQGFNPTYASWDSLISGGCAAKETARLLNIALGNNTGA